MRYYKYRCNCGSSLREEPCPIHNDDLCPYCGQDVEDEHHVEDCAEAAAEAAAEEIEWQRDSWKDFPQ